MSVLWNSSEILQALAINDDKLQNFGVLGVSIDSRKINNGDLFVCLKGDVYDGHDFAQQAIDKGAVAVICDREILSDKTKEIIYSDTYQALLELAKFRRSQISGEVIAITGSVGKTTIKEALYFVLKNFRKSYVSKGNYNNHIGLPLSLVNCPKDTEIAIFELGMNNPGEIEFLTNILNHNLAIINIVALSHIGNFKDIEEIAISKSEIFSNMQKPAKIILNADNSQFAQLLKIASEKYQILPENIYHFGSNNLDNLQINNIEILDNLQCAVSFVLAGQEYKMQLNFSNKEIAKLFVIIPLIVDILHLNVAKALKYLSKFMPLQGRGNLVKLKYKNLRIINDTYNAGPDSMKQALITLANLGKYVQGRKIAILADMLELGSQSEKFHFELSNQLMKLDIDKVITIGEEMKNLYDNLQDHNKLIHYKDSAIAASEIDKYLMKDDLILIKGSRGLRTEKIFDQLIKLENDL